VRGQITGQEPALGQDYQGAILPDVSGQEPMLGGQRRPRLDRELFWDLLDMDSHCRLTAAETILEQGSGRFYGAAMTAVLAPDARYFQPGHLWKIPYSYEQKLAAMDSLVRLDAERALGGLIIALNNQDSGIQRIAIWFIGQLETDRAQSALLTILDDPRPELRYVAFYALSERWGLPAIKRLVSAKGYIVSEAARALGQCFQTPRVLDPLIVALHEERESARDNEIAQTAIIEAIVSLVQQQDAHAKSLGVEALSTLLESGRTGRVVADAAVEGLRQIDTPEARAAAIQYQSGHDTLDRVAFTQQHSGNG